MRAEWKSDEVSEAEQRKEMTKNESSARNIEWFIN